MAAFSLDSFAGWVRRRTGGHVGILPHTHVDAPVHFLPGDRHIAQMPVDQWIGEAAVVDLTHLGDNGEVTAADLEKKAGHVKAGDIVLLRTDWPRRADVASERFWRDAPWTGRSACDWLLGEVQPKASRANMVEQWKRPQTSCPRT